MSDISILIDDTSSKKFEEDMSSLSAQQLADRKAMVNHVAPKQKYDKYASILTSMQNLG